MLRTLRADTALTIACLALCACGPSTEGAGHRASAGGRGPVPRTEAVAVRAMEEPRPAEQDPVREERFRIVDADGEPVAGARIEVWPSADDERTADSAAIADIARGSLRRHEEPLAPLVVLESDAEGRCRAMLDKRAACVLATTEDGRTSGWVWLRGLLPAGELSVVVYRRFTIQGVVRAPDGAPVQEARVDFACNQGDTSSGRGFVPRNVEPVWTDADGRFEAQVDPDALYTMRASTADLVTEQRRVWTEPGGSASVALRALGSAVLEVALVDADGDVVLGGVAVAVHGEPDPRDPFPERFVSMPGDARGQYEIALPGPGSYVVRATGPYLASNAPLEVAVPAGRDRATVQIQLPDPVSIRGRLVMPDEVPLADAVVVAEVDQTQLPWATDALESATTAPQRVRTDYDGTFEVTRLHPEFVYDLRCEREEGDRGFVLARGVRGAEREQTFMVGEDQLAGAVVRVDVDTAGPAPRPERIRYDLWERRGAQWAKQRTDVDAKVAGRTVRIEGLVASGVYALVVHADGFATSAHGPWTCRRFVDSIGIELAAPGSVHVLVRDGTGRPIPAAEVRVLTNPLLPFLGPPATARTDGEGVATILGLPAGSATVTAEQGGVESTPRRIVIRPGLPADVELRIR